ncbi:MAG: SDR family NAD(P)-dependent oxidoreductase [Pseudorhodoplanes sp.]
MADPTGRSAPTVLIIGASRGLGFGLAREYLARGWQVIGTVRGKAETVLHGLLPEAKGRLEIEHLEMTDNSQIEALHQRLAGRKLDLLWVNAGIAYGAKETINTVSDDQFVAIMVTNALAPMRVVEKFQDLVAPNGMIALMSSGLGSVTNNTRGTWEVYRASKAALNTLMRSFDFRHKGESRSLVLVAPGWVKTDMGGPEAEIDLDTSMKGVVNMLERQAGKPGLVYMNYKGETLPW